MYDLIRVFGWLVGIDGEPEFVPERSQFIVSSADPKKIIQNIPKDYYLERRAGHIRFDNLPEVIWDVEFIRYEVTCDDEMMDALVKAYNARNPYV